MNIKVIDNVLSHDVLCDFEKVLAKRPWFLGRDGERSSHFSLGLARARKYFGQEEVYFLSRLEEHGVDVSSIARCYYNCFRKGDRPSYHKDFGRFTYMFYLNQEWNQLWGAPTKFKKTKFSFSRSIFPVPGRLVIFDSTLWHKGTAPNILMPNRIAGRMSIAFHEGVPQD